MLELNRKEEKISTNRRNGLLSASSPFKDYEGKILFFLAFSTKKRANFDYSRVFGHGEFNDDIYNLCTTTQGCYALPRRHQDRALIDAQSVGVHGIPAWSCINYKCHY